MKMIKNASQIYLRPLLNFKELMHKFIILARVRKIMRGHKIAERHYFVCTYVSVILFGTKVVKNDTRSGPLFQIRIEIIELEYIFCKSTRGPYRDGTLYGTFYTYEIIFTF